MQFKRVAIDISKHAYTLHGVGDQERPVLRRDLRRAEVETFFGKLASTEVIMEACGGAHHWSRVLAALGHQVRLIPAQYVKQKAETTGRFATRQLGAESSLL